MRFLFFFLSILLLSPLLAGVHGYFPGYVVWSDTVYVDGDVIIGE